MLKLLSLELGLVGLVVLALTVADIPAITVGITAATGFIGALGYWIIAIIKAIKTKQDAIAAKQDDVLLNQAALAATAADVLAKQEVIAGKVDGTASAAVKEIQLLQQQVAMLLADKAEKKETAAVLAVATAAKPG